MQSEVKIILPPHSPWVEQPPSRYPVSPVWNWRPQGPTD